MRRRKSRPALAEATAGRPKLQINSYLVFREAYFVKSAIHSIMTIFITFQHSTMAYVKRVRALRMSFVMEIKEEMN